MIITGFLFGLGLIGSIWAVSLGLRGARGLINVIMYNPPPFKIHGRDWEAPYREQWWKERKLGRRIV